MATIDSYFQYLVEVKGSDLHLSEGSPPKVRVHGSVSAIPDQPILEGDDFKALLGEICEPAAFAQYLEEGDLDFAYEMDEESRFRCNYMKQQNGLGAVFRLIPTEIASIEDLNLPPVIKEFGHMRSGLVLVTGPTGSGKSTSLAALIDYINSNFSRHIITIEEPIEFVHKSKQSIITQREVPIQTPEFSDGLRACLREDADIVLVGEMRDLETIRLALEAAETGHMVFGTLHTSSAAKTIDRVIDVFPASEKSMVRSMLSESLAAVISQNLLKKIGGGRVAAHEIMLCTPAIRNLIREDKVAQMYSAIQTGGQLGMQTLDQCLKSLIERKLITKEQAREKAKIPDDFR